MFLINFLSQVVLCVNQLRWTERLESIFEDQRGLKGLKSFHDELNMQLEDIVNLIRSGLTTLERITLGALIVIQVHNKDVVKELIDKKVDRVTSFDWMAQLRYYFDMNSLKVFVSIFLFLILGMSL
jgi:dynein heavy chain, axonemal